MKSNADLLPEVLDFCRQNGLLPSGGRIIVGLSGGPDSLALLDILHRLAPRHGLTVVAAHLNHSLRGAASDADEAAVRRVCAGYGVRLYVRRRDIAAAAADSCQSPEEAGRRARYAFFDAVARAEAAAATAGHAGGSRNPDERRCLYRQPDSVPAAAAPGHEPQVGSALLNSSCQPDANQSDANQSDAIHGPASALDDLDRRLSEQELAACLEAGVRVAVGHHRNDQAETVLLNLGRGSGIDGLAGMRPRNGLVIRPLLDVSRARIDAYIIWRGLEPCIDATNFETAATRNRLRHRVLPALNEAFGFDAVPALARAARLLRQDADYLQCQATETLAALRAHARLYQAGSHLVEDQFPEAQSLDRQLPGQVAALLVKDAAALHPALLNRVLRLWYHESFGDMRDLSESQVSGLAGLCQQGRSGRRCSLPHGRQALRDFDWLILLDTALPFVPADVPTAVPASVPIVCTSVSPDVSTNVPTAVPASVPTDISASVPAAVSASVPAAVPASVPAADSDRLDARSLRLTGTTEIPGGGFFVTQFIVDKQQIVYNSRIWCFQASELTGTVVRHRLPHDRLQVEGSMHGKLLKKLLCERQVPAGLRDRLPLIARNATVLWIPGVAASSRLPVGPDNADIPPQQWLVVRYIRPEAAADGMSP